MEYKPYQLLFLSDASSPEKHIAPLLMQTAASARITRVESLEEVLRHLFQDAADILFIDGAVPTARHDAEFLLRCAPHVPMFVLIDDRDQQPLHSALSDSGVAVLVKQELTAEGLASIIRRELSRFTAPNASAGRASQEDATSRSAEVSDLTWGLIHELSQPLTAIANFAEAGAQAVDSSRVRPEYLKNTLRTVAELAQQAGRTMDCLRKLTLGETVDYEEVLVNAILPTVLEQLKSEAQRREARLLMVLEPSLRPAWINGVQLSQALLNIGRNALEAVAEVPPQRRVVQFETTQGTRDISIIVSDRGKGMDRKTLARIFEPRFTTKPMGMGVGLPISRAMLDSMGGSLKCTSQEGVGTTFHISLPLAKSSSS